MHALLIEDNDDHAEIFQDNLSMAFEGQANLVRVSKLQDGLLKLSNSLFDICFCDLSLPDSKIEETVSKLNTLHSSTPIVILTSLNEKDVIREFVKQGIQDYLPKSDLNPGLLFRISTYSIERRSKELQLEQKNADQKMFCQSLSHDFKAPVRRIRQYAQILKDSITDRLELTEDEQEFFTYILDNTLQANKLIDGLYRYLTVEEGVNSMGPVDLNKVVWAVSDAITQIDESVADITIEELPTINGSDPQLRVLFQNLLMNAIAHCDKKPIIHVSAEQDDVKKVCVIAVKDNGIGIAAKDIERIFHPFQHVGIQKEADRGSGLGLTIVKRIVDIHRGSIRVVSELGKGSVFYIEFPIFQSNAT